MRDKESGTKERMLGPLHLSMGSRTDKTREEERERERERENCDADAFSNWDKVPNRIFPCRYAVPRFLRLAFIPARALVVLVAFLFSN